MSTKTQRPRRNVTDAEREARRAADRQLMQDAVDALASSEGWQRWLHSRAAFHKYSLNNQLLIAMQCPHATHVAGFRHWLELGYCVRKGERSIRIWTPMKPTKAQIAKWEKDGRDPKTKPGVRFRLGPVFDRSQVDALPDFPGGPALIEAPLAPVEGDEHADLLAPLIAFASDLDSMVTVEPVPGSASGFYEPSSRRIVVDVLSPTMSANGQVKTLIHELAHLLVDIDRDDDDPELTYADGEVVAETTAYCVLASIPFDTSGYSVPYVASWAARGDGSESIHRYAQLIDRLARRIEDVIFAAWLESLAD